MQVNDRIRAILKVQLGLNYLKLCTDHQNPTGGGVPVDIVVLPDFVVDIDGYAVTQLNQGNLKNRLAAAEVGGRAGRIVSILAHLRDLNDESIGLHYIAKTDDVGRAVLKKRLNTDLRAKHLQPVTFPFVLASENTRYTVLGRTEREFVRNRQIVKNTQYLTCDDLRHHFYEPMKTLANAAAVYFGTDSVGQFTRLLECVLLGSLVYHSPVTGEDPGRDRHVFVDFSAIQGTEPTVPPEALQSYTEAVAKLRDAQSKEQETGPSRPCTHLMVMVLSDGSPVELLWDKFGLVAGDVLLVYDGNKTVQVLDQRNAKPCAVTVKYQQRPGPRDAFVAGCLLHRAIASAWQRIPPLQKMRHVYAEDGSCASKTELQEWLNEWPEGLFPRPHADNAGGWPVLEAVQFGEALAKLWAEETNLVPDRRNLLFENLDMPSKQRWFAGSADFETTIMEALDVIDNHRESIDPVQFFIYATLLTKHWVEDSITGDLARRVRECFASLLNVDLAIQPQLWLVNGNGRSHTLRIPQLRTVRTLFVLDALHRMSMVGKWQQTPATRACMLDLDGTLIQSSGLRSMCLRRAFLAMVDADPAYRVASQVFPGIRHTLQPSRHHNEPFLDVLTFLDRCQRLYHHAIYDRDSDWAELLQSYPYYAFGDLSKDFRQVWNHPLSYVVFSYVMEQCLARRGCFFSSRDSPVAIMIQACDDNHFHAIDQMLTGQKKQGDKKEFTTPTKDLIAPYDNEQMQKDLAIRDQKHRKLFRAAVSMYWQIEYQAMPHTKQFLQTLRDVLSARLYIATEGHHDTQLAKIRVVGLNEFFSDLCTMSTGAAATSAEHVRSIEVTMKEYKKKVGDAKRDEDLFVELIRRRLDELLDDLIQGQSGPVFDKDPMVLRIREVLDDKKKEEESLERECGYLKELYKRQWDYYAGKEMEVIYSLITACILADAEKPFLYLTNLTELVVALQGLVQDHQGLSLAMIGDREKKDIRPLLGALENRDAVTTVRLLTRDHCSESLYWRQEPEHDKPLAKYVAWNPVQSLLLLVSTNSWPDRLTYRRLPAIVKARLFSETGEIDDKYCWPAMVWGESRREETYTLMNYFITESTVRTNTKGIVGFAGGLRQRLLAAGQHANDDEYHFAWATITQFLANIIAIGECCTKVAEIIRDAVCDEIQAGRVSENSDHRGKALNCLRALSGSEQRIPCCLPPNVPPETLTRHFPFEDTSRQDLSRILAAWRKEGVLKLAQALRTKLAEARRAGDTSGAEYRCAWTGIVRFLVNVIDLNECSERVAGIIRDAVCDEIGGGRVERNPDLARVAVDLLEKLSGDGEKTSFCPPPSVLDQVLIDHVPSEEDARLRSVLENWRQAGRSDRIPPV